MEDDGEFTPEERLGRRKILRDRETEKRKEAQKRVEGLTDWLKAPNRPIPK
jgi:hypothetical protein